MCALAAWYAICKLFLKFILFCLFIYEVLEEWAQRPLVKQGELEFQSKIISKKKFTVSPKKWKKKYIVLSSMFLVFFDSKADMHQFRYYCCYYLVNLIYPFQKYLETLWTCQCFIVSPLI